MKICHITVAHRRYDARIYLRESSALANHGHEVLLICADGKDNEIRNGVQIISFTKTPMSKLSRFKLLLINRRFVKYLCSLPVDVYQFHDIELLEVGRKLKKLNKKVIFDSHENWIHIIPEYFPKSKLIQNFIRTRIVPYYYNRVVSQFDAVLSVSPNMVSELKKYNENTYFVPNYPSISKVVNTPEIKSDYFIYQGMVYKISNQKALVTAINNLNFDFKYKVVGKINSKLKEDLQILDINNRVEFKNWVDKSELDNIMRYALAGFVVLDYCTICCGKEGQLGSNKIFEYMLCGLPVICTDFKLWKECIVDKYKCGICVEPNNVSQIQNAVEWILSNRNEALEMGQRGRDAILKEFNWELYEDFFVSMYDKIYTSIHN